jgi:hypothetical protein
MVVIHAAAHHQVAGPKEESVALASGVLHNGGEGSKERAE